MSDYLFDTPYWVLGVVGVVGIALLVSANARQDKRLRSVGLGLLGVAVLLGLLSVFVDTDKEKVNQRTRQLVTAIEKKDKATVERLLHPKARLGGRDGMTKPEIVERTGTAIDQFNIKGIRITAMDTRPADAGDIEVILSATADMDLQVWSGGMPSDWRLVWENTGTEWQLRDIIPMKIPTMDTGQLINRLKSMVGAK
jgi:hypothetical protein